MIFTQGSPILHRGLDWSITKSVTHDKLYNESGETRIVYNTCRRGMKFFKGCFWR